MAVTITPYDHTARRMQAGNDGSADTYKINLYTSFSFDPADTTKTAAESGGTQVSTGFGYTEDDKELEGVTVVTLGTNGSSFDADDVIWTASGGDIVASYALIYNDTDTNDPPLYFIDFGLEFTALDGAPFIIAWDADGISTVTVV